MSHQIFVSCPRNMEYLLESELRDLGLDVTRVSPQGVYGCASLSQLYAICLWSRLANRVQLILFEAQVGSVEDCHRACLLHPWSDVFSVDRSFAIEFHGQTSYINNTMYGGQLIKDGIVDSFQEQCQQRPNVDKTNPDVLIHGYIKRDMLTVSLDMAGYSLHQRGYRLDAGGAPLKENVAAAMLFRANWPARCSQGESLVDPFCGSGTLLIEAAMMATRTAPGLLRQDQAFRHWLGHDESVWQSVWNKAKQQTQVITNSIQGFDCDASVIELARANIQRAGMSDYIQVKPQSVIDLAAQLGVGLLVCNPPYGQRLKDPLSLMPLYQALGQVLHRHYQGWSAAILTTNEVLAQSIGLRVAKKYQFYNGALQATLYMIQLDSLNQLKQYTGKKRSAHMDALYNRLLKNKKHLSKWRKRTQVTCYRLYDADLPDYAFAIDVYADWVHVQEYAPPKEIPEHKAKKRVTELQQLLPEVLDVPANHIVLKQRCRQRGKEQYQRFSQKKQCLLVSEANVKCKVNLHDYLDTGLFLDHRRLRLRIAQQAKGKRLLNCFCYTAMFSVHAAAAGAITCNVDMSKTYLSWAKENFELNGLALRSHRFIQADCMRWFSECRELFDIIILDPPSFSNSKRMQNTLDIQRDHGFLIESAMALLAPGGVLYFSNNYQRFQLDSVLTQQYEVKDITPLTLDEDFKRKPKIHCCFELRHASEPAG